MSGQYAASTDVSSDRSRAEIERTLTRYGAKAFSYAWQEGSAAIQFVAHDRRIRFVLPLPDRDGTEFAMTPTGRDRAPRAAEAAYEQAVRQKWRALALMVKAKLEGVASGIVTFEDEFMAHTVLPSGHTVAEEIGPQVAQAYVDGSVKRLEIGR